MFQRADGTVDIRQQRGVDGAVAEIFPQGFGNGLLVIDQERDGLIEPFDTFLGGGRPVLQVGLPLQLEHVAHPYGFARLGRHCVCRNRSGFCHAHFSKLLFPAGPCWPRLPSVGRSRAAA